MLRTNHLILFLTGQHTTCRETTDINFRDAEPADSRNNWSDKKHQEYRPTGAIYMNNISTLLGREQWMKEFRCYEVKIEESERLAVTGS